MRAVSGFVMAAALWCVIQLLPSEAAAQNCALRVKASLDMMMDDTGRISVPVTVNGDQQKMLVDTGASQSLITNKLAKDLNLPLKRSKDRSYMMGYGGVVDTNVATIKEFGFGRISGKDLDFFVTANDFGAEGLLGSDFLYFFDLDFDFANAKMDLIAPDHCPGQVVYWTKQPYGVVPFEFDEGHIKIWVQLDGKNVLALLDTGAADNVANLDKLASLFDLDKTELMVKRAHRFKTLIIGGITVSNPAINLATQDESAVLGGASWAENVIIGMSVLRRFHLYISYKEKKIYVTPATQY